MAVGRNRNISARLLERLEPRQLLAFDSLIISELLASNDSTIVDEDGQHNDWIEIHNPTDSPISLSGWTLTDDPDSLDQWAFPAIEIGARDYLIVFASGKDRATADQPLHTNFRLSSDGEYIAIVDDQQQVVHDLEFPPQREDISFGLSVDQRSLIGPGATFTWHQPTPSDASLQQRWTETDFDDRLWQTGSGVIGYDQRPGLPNVGFETDSFQDWDVSGPTFTVGPEFGVEPSQGNRQALLLANSSGATRFSLETFMGLPRATLDDVRPEIQATRGSGIKRTFSVEAGDEITFDWQFLTDEPEEDTAADFAFVVINPGQTVLPLAFAEDATDVSPTEFSRESALASFQHTFDSAGDYTLGVGIINESSQVFNSALLLDNVQVGGVGSLADTFNSVIETPIQPTSAESAGSLWLRYSFDLSQVDDLTELQIPLQYDDGYVVYLNGEPLRRENAPEPAIWDSLALSDREDALAFDEQLVRLPPDALQPGTNVLAIQVLKAAAADPSILHSASLLGIGQLAETATFLDRPTPNRANTTDAFLFADPVQFSQPHGFYDQPFDLQLSTSTSDGQIHYTLDGSAPTRESPLYEAPLRIERTATVRAFAVRDDLEPSRPETRSYLFIEDVVNQTRESVLERGFPESWGDDVPDDYEMDRRVIGQNGTDLFDGRYADTIRDDLKSVPTLSLVMDQEDLFGPEGFYSNPAERGVAWERPTSVELIHPDGSEGFQVDAGVRVQGGVLRNTGRQLTVSKLSMRLLFKGDYGAAKLEYPLFGPHAADVFDSISLRSSSGEHLVGIHYLRDEFARRSQLATGNQSSHGNFMHVYINGVYWGLYNPVERIDEQFGANYYGGEKEEYDVFNASDTVPPRVSAIAGTREAWDTLVELSEAVQEADTQSEKTAAYLRLQGRNADGSRNPDWEVYLDTLNFADYILTQVYLRNSDWPIRNYSMLRRRGPESTGFKFYVWDAEFTLDQGRRRSLSSLSTDDFGGPGPGPGLIFNLLDSSDAFKLDLSDRAQALFSPGGAFYVNPTDRDWDPEDPEDNIPAARYNDLVKEVFSPIVAETARWGDESGRNGVLLTRDNQWMNTVESNLDNFFPDRSRSFIADLKRLDYFREPPTFGIAPGQVPAGTLLELASESGTIYYTLDGSDPRAADGNVSDAAIRYDGPISFTGQVMLTTRALTEDGWTAIDQGRFFTDIAPANSETLRISEVNFNPYDAQVGMGEPDGDNERFEFIEIANISSTPVDLTGVELAEVDGQGVRFTFGQQLLGVGGRTVVPRDREAFLARYQDSGVLARGAAENESDWVYTGRLGNGGERITLLDNSGQLIQQLDYGDSRPWPERADGEGSSLELTDLEADPSLATSYSASVDVGGSPGHPGSVSERLVRINEVQANPLDDQPDSIELLNVTDETVSLDGWYLSDDLDELFRYRFPDDTRLLAFAMKAYSEELFDFGISAAGETLSLISADSTGRPGKFIDVVTIGGSDDGVTLGRWPNGRGQMVPLARATLGETNSEPLIGDVIISEIYYGPFDPDAQGPLAPEVFEYVELYNRSDSTVDLSGWQLTGDVQFTLPVRTQLDAGATLLVAPFDAEQNTERAVAFQLTFGSPPALPILGPWHGQLPNSGGTLQLHRPLGELDLDGSPSVTTLVDTLAYLPNRPWPSTDAPSIDSIHRKRDTSFASFGTNWRADRTSPGTVQFESGLLGDLTGDGQRDIHDVDFLCSGVRSDSEETRFDVNADGAVELADLDFLLRELIRTTYGDSNLDGVFNSADLVNVFETSEYQDGVPQNSTWAEGDWNCDGDFTSSDLVRAFVFGNYTSANRAAADATAIDELLAAAQPTSVLRLTSTHEASGLSTHSLREIASAFATPRRPDSSSGAFRSPSRPVLWDWVTNDTGKQARHHSTQGSQGARAFL